MNELENMVRELRDHARKLLELLHGTVTTRIAVACEDLLDSIKKSEKLVPPIGLDTTLKY